jgi:hypothetical protein
VASQHPQVYDQVVTPQDESKRKPNKVNTSISRPSAASENIYNQAADVGEYWTMAQQRDNLQQKSSNRSQNLAQTPSTIEDAYCLANDIQNFKPLPQQRQQQDRKSSSGNLDPDFIECESCQPPPGGLYEEAKTPVQCATIRKNRLITQDIYNDINEKVSSMNLTCIDNNLYQSADGGQVPT